MMNRNHHPLIIDTLTELAPGSCARAQAEIASRATLEARLTAPMKLQNTMAMQALTLLTT